MKKVLVARFTETDLINVKDGDTFKFSEEGQLFTADGDAYLNADETEAIVETLEDTMRYEDDCR